jgi:hypothetical protein
VSVPSLGSHGRELDQLRAALRTRSIAAHLARVADRDGARAARACRVLDVKYEPGVRCTILYELDARPVVAMIGWNEATASDVSLQDVPVPNMEFYAWPDDPGIFGLTSFMELDAMVDVLARALSCGRDHVLRARATLVRYRPRRRCTLRVDMRVRRAGGHTIELRTVYAKLYHDVAKARSVWEEMRLLHRCEALRRAGAEVAEPLALVPELGLVVQRPLPGAALDGLLAGDAGPHLVHRAARALAGLHEAGLRTARVRPIDALLTRMAGWAEGAGTIDRALSAHLGEVVATLTVSRDRLPAWGEEITLVHGDCKPSQFLVDGRSLALLDFDHCGMADPALDAGNFLATLRQVGVRHELKARTARRAPLHAAALRRLEQEYLRAYAAARGDEGALAQRAQWYEAVALTRKAYRSWQRSPWSPLPHALLRQARTCLDALPLNGSRRGRRVTAG